MPAKEMTLSDPRNSGSYCAVVNPIMDLNIITREYKHYQRKLSKERLLDLREMLRSLLLESDTCESLAHNFGSRKSDQSTVPKLLLLSMRTIRAYENVLKE